MATTSYVSSLSSRLSIGLIQDKHHSASALAAGSIVAIVTVTYQAVTAQYFDRLLAINKQA